jgi:O-antigen/teichoic acid export membrane protein
MVVTIGANYVLIPLAGYEGSAVAALVCYFSMTAVCYFLGQRYYPIPYHMISGLTYILFTVALLYAVNAIHFAGQISAFLFHSSVILVYLIGIYFIERRNFGLNRA